MDAISIFTPLGRCPVPYAEETVIPVSSAITDEKQSRFHHRKVKLTEGSVNTIMHLSETFNTNMKRLKEFSSKEKKVVGLMVRFDNNDALTEVFWNENYRVLTKPVQLGFHREPVTYIDLKRSSGFTVSGEQPVLGGHCEELFIRSWDTMIKYNKCHPIVLTLSPCFNRSNWCRDSSGHLWSAGCAPKLFKFITEKNR